MPYTNWPNAVQDCDSRTGFEAGGEKMGLFEALFKSKNKVNLRTSLRRSKKIPFLVTGQDENGFSIHEEASTRVVNLKGGSIILKSDVKVGGKITLRDSSGVAFLVEVRSYKYDVVTNLRYVGFQVIRPAHRWAETVMTRSASPSTPVLSNAYDDCNWLR
jgi:hypothetical protein